MKKIKAVELDKSYEGKRVSFTLPGGTYVAGVLGTFRPYVGGGGVFVIDGIFDEIHLPKNHPVTVFGEG